MDTTRRQRAVFTLAVVGFGVVSGLLSAELRRQMPAVPLDAVKSVQPAESDLSTPAAEPVPERLVQRETVGSGPKPVRAGAPILKSPYGDVAILPRDNPWNRPVTDLPVHANSREYIASIGINKPLHPDFGTTWEGAPNGIPYVVVPGNQPKVPVRFEYDSQSDPGPYPIPPNPPIEGGPAGKGDRHIIIVDPQNRKLYELFSAFPEGLSWRAGSGAIFDLTSNRLRPAGWTSADAAGLPIFPGLVRYDEVVGQGEIRHALRFTVERTQRAWISPATHFASRSNDPKLPPMGLRLRLKADYDISGFPPPAKVILRALQTYGMFLADNGGDLFLSGAPDPRWSDDDLGTLKRVTVSAFEAVETGPLIRE